MNIYSGFYIATNVVSLFTTGNQLNSQFIHALNKTAKCLKFGLISYKKYNRFIPACLLVNTALSAYSCDIDAIHRITRYGSQYVIRWREHFAWLMLVFLVISMTNRPMTRNYIKKSKSLHINVTKLFFIRITIHNLHTSTLHDFFTADTNYDLIMMYHEQNRNGIVFQRLIRQLGMKIAVGID